MSTRSRGETQLRDSEFGRGYYFFAFVAAADGYDFFTRPTNDPVTGNANASVNINFNIISDWKIFRILLERTPCLCIIHEQKYLLIIRFEISMLYERILYFISYKRVNRDDCAGEICHHVSNNNVRFLIKSSVTFSVRVQ